MKKINIITSAKIKSDFIKLGTKFYLERLSKYIKSEIIIKKNFDADTLSKFFDTKNYAAALSEKGDLLDSIEFSKKINSILVRYDFINFFIGEPEGLDKKIIEKSNLVISLSNLTFTSELAILILTEQLYRSFTIINHHPYHKL